MKKIMSILMLVVMLVVQCVAPIASAYTESGTQEVLYDCGKERGNSTPSTPGSLPYTGSWNSVSNYTKSNYYFTGCSTYKLSLNVSMNTYGDTGRFKLYLVNLTDGSERCVIDSSSEKTTYEASKSVSAVSTHKYYLRFEVSDNTSSCWGDMKIEKK